MKELGRIIKTICGRELGPKIHEDYNTPNVPTKSASTSPRKSPTKPSRILPSRDSPQKRKVIFPDPEDDPHVPESPSKRQKVVPVGLVTLESIRQTRSMSSSPTKPLPGPSTPRKAPRLASSPFKSPTKPQGPATPSRALKVEAMDDDASSSEEEDHKPPPPRRRFRPVFRDQQQWAMCDPRLAELAKAAADFNQRMVKRFGLPFQDHRQDVDMDSE